jgi:nicotinamide riboside transporter PnuC
MLFQQGLVNQERENIMEWLKGFHWITGLIIGIVGILFMASTESQVGDMIGMVIVVIGAALIIKLKRKI